MHLLAALALLALNAVEFPPQAPPVQTYWAIACTYNECGDLEAPMVIFKETGLALGYYYFNTHTVFVTEECLNRMADSTKCEGVLIHEMTHYIADHVDGISGQCESEARAWDVYNAYVMDKGRLDLVRENWLESYPQCANPT